MNGCLLQLFVMVLLASVPLCAQDLNLDALALPEPDVPVPAGPPQAPSAPGFHPNIACATRPADKYCLYLPAGYTNAQEAHFPSLYVHNAGGYVEKDVKRYAAWADRSGVVVVGIYKIRNGMPDHEKRPIQDAVLASLDVMGVRVHPCLRYTIGMSGGSADGYRMVRRMPQKFAGVVMIGASTKFSDPAQRHLCLAYLHGAKDEWSVRGIYQENVPAAWTNGNPVKVRIGRTRKHDWAPQAEQEDVLDWMLALSKLTHPTLTAAERAAFAEQARARVRRCIENADPAAARAECEKLLELPIRDWPEYPALVERWMQAVDSMAGVRGTAATNDPIARLAMLEAVRRGELAGHIPAEWKSKVDGASAGLLTDPAVARDWSLACRLREIEEQECRAGLDLEATRAVSAAYEALAAEAPDSPWGRAAAEQARPLQAYVAKGVDPSIKPK